MIPNNDSIVGILPAGDPGTGKDTVINQLPGILPVCYGKTWEIKSTIGTETFRPLAEKHNMTLVEFIEKCKNDPTFQPDLDVKTDTAALELCQHLINHERPFIMGSRILPALLYRDKNHRQSQHIVRHHKRLFTILFYCSDQPERIRKLTRRDLRIQLRREPTELEIRNHLNKTEDDTRRREMRDKEKFMRIYGIENAFDHTFFDATLDMAGIDEVKQAERTASLVLSRLPVSAPEMATENAAA